MGPRLGALTATVLLVTLGAALGGASPAAAARTVTCSSALSFTSPSSRALAARGAVRCTRPVQRIDQSMRINLDVAAIDSDLLALARAKKGCQGCQPDALGLGYQSPLSGLPFKATYFAALHAPAGTQFANSADCFTPGPFAKDTLFCIESARAKAR